MAVVAIGDFDGGTIPSKSLVFFGNILNTKLHQNSNQIDTDVAAAGAFDSVAAFCDMSVNKYCKTRRSSERNSFCF